MTESNDHVHEGTKSLQELAEEIERERQSRGFSPLDVTISPEDEEPTH